MKKLTQQLAFFLIMLPTIGFGQKIVAKTMKVESQKIINLSNVSNDNNRFLGDSLPRFDFMKKEVNENIILPDNKVPDSIYKAINLYQQDSVDKQSFFRVQQKNSPNPAATFNGVVGGTWSPDIAAASNRDFLLHATNFQVVVQNRNGNEVRRVFLPNLWRDIIPNTIQNPWVFDPRVLYDPFSERWIIVALHGDGANAGGANVILIATSTTNNPNDQWRLHRINIDTTTHNIDFPLIGFNRNNLVIVNRMFPNPQTRLEGFVRIDALSKTQLYGGNAVSSVFNVAGNLWDLCPIADYDNESNINYLIKNNGGNTNNSGCLRLCTISANSQGVLEFSNPDNLICSEQTWSDWIPETNGGVAPQRDTTANVEFHSTKVHNAVLRNGSIWCVNNVFLPLNNPFRSSVLWWQINPNTMPAEIQQFGMIDSPSDSAFYGYPSIAVDRFSNVLIGYNTFSKNIFPTASYSMRACTDPLNSLQSPNNYALGQGTYSNGGCENCQNCNDCLRCNLCTNCQRCGRNRWGDYSSTIVDPNGINFWTLQEFARNNNTWGTQWANVNSPINSGFICKVKVNITGKMHDDDHPWAGTYCDFNLPEINTEINASERIIYSSPFATACCGDEVRYGLTLTARTDGSIVKIGYRLKLYEGTDCFSEDLDGYTEGSIKLSLSDNQNFEVSARNIDENADDWVKIMGNISTNIETSSPKINATTIRKEGNNGIYKITAIHPVSLKNI
jgi:hypothetical protein